MIDGVRIKKLKVIPDERGRLMEFIRADDEFFEKVGQIYVTTTYPGVVKAWHMHEKQDDNMACAIGMVKVVLCDGRKKSPTFNEVNEFFMGVHSPILIHIPAGIWHGWKCVSLEEALVVNAPTEMYNYKNPDEQRLDPREGGIKYDWDRRDG
jgi:dTDP-4-dehydrorhamnose 3,5-epimerase